MNDYEKKLDDRKKRLMDRAEKIESNADDLLIKARSMSSSIPMGQPILVGHHSESRDRRFRDKIHNTFGRSYELQDKAIKLKRAAAMVGKGGISSDDPEALDKLRKRLDSLMRNQEVMVKANKLIRAGNIDGLKGLGLSDAAIEDLLRPDFCGKIGFASYSLTNNLSNAKRVKARIEELEAKKELADVVIDCGWYCYKEDVDDNRVCFLFSDKPDSEVRLFLQKHGFKWSPRREGQPWIRKLNNASIYAGKVIREFLDKKS